MTSLNPKFSFRYLCILVCAVLFSAQPASAHNRFEVSATAGYRFGGRADVDYNTEGNYPQPAGRIVFDGSPSYGAILGYRVKHDGFAYFSYSRQKTNFSFDSNDGINDRSGTMAIEYYQIGGNLETTQGIFVPYLGASVGLARFRSYGGGADRLFFAPMLDGGIKFDLLPQLHLRILGRLPIVFSNGKLYCEDGKGCLELDKFAPIVQGEVQAGIGVSF